MQRVVHMCASAGPLGSDTAQALLLFRSAPQALGSGSDRGRAMFSGGGLPPPSPPEPLLTRSAVPDTWLLLEHWLLFFFVESHYVEQNRRIIHLLSTCIYFLGVASIASWLNISFFWC